MIEKISNQRLLRYGYLMVYLLPLLVLLCFAIGFYYITWASVIESSNWIETFVLLTIIISLGIWYLFSAKMRVCWKLWAFKNTEDLESLYTRAAKYKLIASNRTSILGDWSTLESKKEKKKWLDIENNVLSVMEQNTYNKWNFKRTIKYSIIDIVINFIVWLIAFLWSYYIWYQWFDEYKWKAIFYLFIIVWIINFAYAIYYLINKTILIITKKWIKKWNSLLEWNNINNIYIEERSWFRNKFIELNIDYNNGTEIIDVQNIDITLEELEKIIEYFHKK